jgi:hypothetical protein
MSKLSSQERRRNPRASGNVPVKISHEAGDIVTETVNISRSGAYCRIDRYIEPMTRMKVNILLPLWKNNRNTTKKVSCEGAVVRTEPSTEKEFFHIAIFFNKISRRGAEVIGDYAEYYLSQ